MEGDGDCETASILASVKEQEAQFKLLTQQLEAERAGLVNQLGGGCEVDVEQSQSRLPQDGGYTSDSESSEFTGGLRKELDCDLQLTMERMKINSMPRREPLKCEPLTVRPLIRRDAHPPSRVDAFLASGYSHTLDPRRDAGGGRSRAGGQSPAAYYSLSRGGRRDEGYRPQGEYWGAAPRQESYNNYDGYNHYATMDMRRGPSGSDASWSGVGTRQQDRAWPYRSFDTLLDTYQNPSLYSLPRHDRASAVSLDKWDGRHNSASTGRRAGRSPGLAEVVGLLVSGGEPRVAANAAAFLQHACYGNEDAKTAVRQLRGIHALVSLLDSPVFEVQRNACGALRNMCFGTNVQNKLAVRDCDGVIALLRLLRQTDDPSLQDVATGTLWNLSSHEELKTCIAEQGLGVLTNSIIIPGSGWDPNARGLCTGIPPVQLAKAFQNATGCLRNISSAGSSVQARLRGCQGLVDALIHYICDAVQQRNACGKALENSVCVLRNLSWHVYRDEPSAQVSSLSPSTAKKAGKDARRRPKGCNMEEEEVSLNLPERIEPAKGAELLFQPETVRAYVGVFQCSDNRLTLEAVASCIDAVAAGDSQWAVCARSMVRVCGGLPYFVRVLEQVLDGLGGSSSRSTGSCHGRLVWALASAMRTLAKDPRNKTLLGENAISALVSCLPPISPAPPSPPVPEEGRVAALWALGELVCGSPTNGRAVYEAHGVERSVRINHASDASSRERRAAGTLLSSLWAQRDVRNKLHKDGWSKDSLLGSKTKSGARLTRDMKVSVSQEEIPLNDMGPVRC
uniref:splicing regulator ARVCF-like isoform X2 n=1 Tax=Myxine glutinosa TaxID=7769 RepID=UPI00359023C5